MQIHFSILDYLLNSLRNLIKVGTTKRTSADWIIYKYKLVLFGSDATYILKRPKVPMPAMYRFCEEVVFICLKLLRSVPGQNINVCKQKIKAENNFPERLSAFPAQAISEDFAIVAWILYSRVLKVPWIHNAAVANIAAPRGRAYAAVTINSIVCR